MRRWPWSLFLIAGCAAPAAVGPHPLDLAYLAARSGEGCPVHGDVACCDDLSHRMHDARARRDDQTADDEAERLSLTCPARAEALLESGRGGPSYRRERLPKRAFTGVEYELRLPPEDRVVWMAVTVDGARR